MAWGDEDDLIHPPTAPAQGTGGGFGSGDAPASHYRKPGGVRGFVDSVNLGFEKGLERPVDNLALAMAKGARLFGYDDGGETARSVAENRARLAEQEAQGVKPSGAGEVAGNIFGTVPTMLYTKNPFIGGAAQGALLSDKKSVGGVAGDAAVGSVLNYAGGKLVEGLGNAIAPVISPAVRRLEQAGVALTPGMRRGGQAMVREDRAMSKPIVGAAISDARGATKATFNTAAVNEAIAPLGVKVPTPLKPGHDQVAFAHDAVSQAYDQVVPNLSVQINGQQFAQKLAPVAQALPDAQRKEFQRLISLHLKNGQLQGQALKTAQGEIRRLAALYSRSQAAADQELGRALGSVDDELSDAMLAQNPQWAPQLQKVNAAYRGLRIVEDAASRADEGVISTGQLKQSVRRGDFSKGKSQTARGKAFMQDFSEAAREVIPQQLPNSGTADRMLAGNIFANLSGAAELAGFRAGQATDLINRLAPNASRKVAGGVRKLRAPASAAAVSLVNDPDN